MNIKKVDSFYILEDKNRCYKLIDDYEKMNEELGEYYFSSIEDLVEYFRIDKFRKDGIIEINDIELLEVLFNSYFVENYFNYKKHWFKEKMQLTQGSLF